MKKLTALIIATSLWAVYLSKNDTKTNKLKLISPTESFITNKLHERGHVIPYDKVAIQLGSPGNILFIKDDNATVKKGELLVSIDNQLILSEVVKLKRSLNSLELYRDQHVAKMAYRLKRYQEMIESAERRYKHALKYYEYEVGKPHKERLEILQINQRLSELELDNSKSIEALEKRLFDKGFISQTAFDRVIRDRKMDREKLNQTLAEIAAEKKGTPKEELEEEKIKVERLEIELQQKRDQLARGIDEHENKLDELKATIEAKLIEIKQNEETSRNSKAYAPEDGIFIIRKVRDWSAGGVFTPFAQGRGVREDTIVADIISPKKLEIQCLVNETDYHKLRVGDPATLTFDAYPNLELKATIKLVAGVGQDRNIWMPVQDGPSEVYLFNTILHLETPNQSLFPNMSTNISFNLPGDKNRLILPRQALIWKENKAHVLKENKTLTPVEGYAIDAMNFAITKGLKPNEKVWTELGASN